MSMYMLCDTESNGGGVRTLIAVFINLLILFRFSGANIKHISSVSTSYRARFGGEARPFCYSVLQLFGVY